MRPIGWLVLIYGLIVFLGGIFGYVKAESVPSLVAGVVFAVALSTAAFALLNEKWIGMTLALASTALLSAFFLYRFVHTHKFMPAGLMALLSLLVLAFLIYKRTRISTGKR